MTSNYAGSFNSKTANAKSWPITCFVDFIRFTLQTWFYDRRETAMALKTRLAPEVEEKVTLMADHARFLSVDGLNQHEFNVRDVDGCASNIVNLFLKKCSCCRFQLDRIPCVHAITAALRRNVDIYTLCSAFYSVEALRSTYSETIYPCGNEDEWEIPHELKTLHVGVPEAPKAKAKKPQGRPPRKRRPSLGERIVTQRKCSLCGCLGHNRASCNAKL